MSNWLVSRSFNFIQISKSSMTGEGLFNLVQSLSKQQKANFSRFVDARKGSNPNYYTLFERMQAFRSYEEKGIRGKLFQNSSKYYQNREILTDKLIQSMVYFNGSRGSVRSYVLQAIELNAVEQGRKRLEACMLEACERKDWPVLAYLHRFREELKEAYRLDLPLPEGVPAAEEIRGALQSWDMLLDLQRKVKHHLQENFGDHLFHYKSFQSKLEEIPTIGAKGLILSGKVRVSLEILKQDYHKAVQFQEDLVRRLESAPVFLKNALLIKELSILIRLALETGADQIALKSTFALGSVPVSNPREEELKTYHQTKSLISVAQTQGNLEMASKGYSLVLEHTGIFSEGELPTYYFGCATVFFLHGAYAQALEAVTAIRAAKRSHWEELNWSVDALRLLCNYELGNAEVLDPLQRTLVRSARAQEKNYPLFASRWVVKMMNAANQKEALQVWKQGVEEYDSYCGNPKEVLTTKVFDLRPWLESKAHAASMWQVFQDQRQGIKNEMKQIL